MKILQLCNRIPYPLNDGGAIGIFNFTKGYSNAGHDVTLLAMNTKKHFVQEDKLLEPVFNNFRLLTVYVDNSIKLFPAITDLIRDRSYHISRFKSNNYNNKIIEILTELQFDIVHLDGLHLAPYINTIREYSNAKIVMRAHNAEHKIWERFAGNGLPLWKKYYIARLAKQLKRYESKQINNYDLLLPISSEDAKVFKECGCKIKMEIIPASLDLIKYPYNKEQVFPSDIFYIGALDWMPNLEGLIWFLDHVWKLLNLRFPELKFFIAGKNIPSRIMKLNIQNVTVVGEVANVCKFINQHGIMVVPLLSGSGMRIKILEGMALGKMIISTKIGAEGIDTIDGEHILIANTPSDFIKKIEQCLSDKEFTGQTGQNARKLVEERYNNKKNIENLTSIYHQLIHD